MKNTKHSYEMTLKEYVESMKGKTIGDIGLGQTRLSELSRRWSDSLIHALQLGKVIPFDALENFLQEHPDYLHRNYGQILDHIHARAVKNGSGNPDCPDCQGAGWFWDGFGFLFQRPCGLCSGWKNGN